ncbi:hypothetical protein AAFC00_001026 [Neodothiora populina]
MSDETILENNDSLASVVERAAADPATIYSVVYVTASATFSGPTAGYVTQGLPTTSSVDYNPKTKSIAPNAQSSAASSARSTTLVKATVEKSATPVASTSSKASSSTAPTTTAAAAAVSSSASSSAAVSSKSSAAASASASSSSAASSSKASSSTASASSTSISDASAAKATKSASASASPSATSSPGMSSGAKGGIAFAVILALLLVAGLTFFFYRRKKAQRGNAAGAQRLVDADDEKRLPPPIDPTPIPSIVPRASSPLTVSSRASSPRNEAPAPRLSIRPTSRFSLGADPEKTAAALSAIAEIEPDSRSVSPAADPANPFGIHAETVHGASTTRVVSPVPVLRQSQSTVSFELEGSEVPVPSKSAKSSPASPSRAEFGTAAGVPIVAATGAPTTVTGPPPAPSNNVHRIQLEFKPSMDDELELKVGGLVRVLHEYDDGWCLCMTMDRSKQGVAPRTCLSKLPLKPRPNGPPNGRLMGPPPPGQTMRKVSEPPRPNSLVPAPLAPIVNDRRVVSNSQNQRQRTASGPLANPHMRSMSPGPMPPKPMADSRPRSASVGSGATTQHDGASGPGSSPLKPAVVPARKPVPGQAL